MEYWDLYNENREKTGEVHLRGDTIPEGAFHIVVHLCIFNPYNQMLIQRRALNKSKPGLWDVSVGGSSLLGETSLEGVRRETLEELGLDYQASDFNRIMTIYDRGVFDDFYYILDSPALESLTLQEEEVMDARWASLGEILQLIDDKAFVNWKPEFIRLLFSLQPDSDRLLRE